VLIDLEHGAGTEKDVYHQLQALEHTPAAAVVRIESTQRQRIHRILDMGAEGIMCPRITNTAEAAAVASGLHYPPNGTRGVAKMVRATAFGQNFQNYYQQAKENIVGIVQIETSEVLDHLDEIAGPADLTMALGIFGQFDHPLYVDAVKATVNAANKAGKATGVLFFNPNEYTRYRNMGIRMIACGADATFVADTARNMANTLQTLRGSDKTGSQ
jgi:4-hydroxy-2-oxoheptanedioate aldolase